MSHQVYFELVRQLTLGLGYAAVLVLLLIQTYRNSFVGWLVTRAGAGAMMTASLFVLPVQLLLLIAALTGGFAGAVGSDPAIMILP